MNTLFKSSKAMFLNENVGRSNRVILGFCGREAAGKKNRVSYACSHATQNLVSRTFGMILMENPTEKYRAVSRISLDNFPENDHAKRHFFRVRHRLVLEAEERFLQNSKPQI